MKAILRKEKPKGKHNMNIEKTLEEIHVNTNKTVSAIEKIKEYMEVLAIKREERLEILEKARKKRNSKKK